MRDDQPQGQAKDPTKTPPSPSRKRFLADPMPKQGSAAAAASSDSAMSSDSSSDRFRKKTRDLPNLSDCHCCGLRINTTNPKDKLQTLDSVWRIVLLCRKCIKRVESAELCSYCLSEIHADCFGCRDCERRVHRDCVAKYRCSAPWSYCCSELGFSVCVDCWVPKLLANSRVFKRTEKNGLKPCPVGNSRVSGSSGRPKPLKDMVNDAKSVVEKKSSVAAKVKENALGKAAVARRAAKLANGALELVAKKDDNGAKNECLVMSISASDSTTMAVDDADLAFQLHRAMNSSPRISKNFCLINSSCLTVPSIWDRNGDLSTGLLGSKGSSDRSVCRKIEVCTNTELNENTCGTISEPSVYAMASDCGSGIGLDNLKQGRMVYTRRCKKDKECRENGRIVGKCNPGDDNSMISEFQSCLKQDELGYELHPDDARNQSRLECDGNATTLHDGSCNGRLDRYMLKYSKRLVGLKTISNGETLLYDGSCVESKATAMGLPLNCSEECRTFSDASFEYKTVSLQASACASGLDNLKQDGMVYMRRSKRDKEWQQNYGQIVGNCNHGDDNDLISESRSCHKQFELEFEMHPEDNRNHSQLTCGGNATELHDGSCNGKLNRYMLKYSKRPVVLKAISNSEAKMLDDGSS